jgi:NAD(P)-dependent dehydrogenase (short-subunit alcohol dehydrogenase family)
MAQDTVGRVWFVTGCSSGMGLALAEAIANSGDRAIITARSVDQITEVAKKAPDRIKAVPLDIANPLSIRSAVKAAIEGFGQIDVLVNNAGIGLVGAVEECTDEEIQNVFRTNVFGTIGVIREVLPHMRKRRSGVILGMTSVLGFQAVPAVGIYSATKCALEGVLEALAGEVAPLGIKVTILQPGVYKTDFRAKSLAQSRGTIADYASTSGKMRTGLVGYPDSAGDPAKAAAAILALLNSGRPLPGRLALGADAVSLIKNKLKVMEKSLAEWETLSMASGGSEGTMSLHSSAVSQSGS